MRIRLKFLCEDIDRHGNVRRYVRIPGRKKIRLRSSPGSEDFMRDYHAAVADKPEAPRQARGAARGSFGYLCHAYYASATFKALDKSTKDWRRRTLDEICETKGDNPVVMMQPRHVRALRDEKAETPAAANLRIKALRALFKWAVEMDEAPHNPTHDVSFVQYVKQGHHSWTLDEVATYEKRHPIGTKARLAMAILLYTSWRREDAVRLGPQHSRNGRIQYRQAKNEHRNPIDMDIPMHPDLAAIIDATPSGHLTYLVTEYGKPFTANGFGNAFKDWCRQANLPHCSAHGLRKACAARLAERGATPHEIMAITGHFTLEEVERYTRSVQKSRLADSAMAKLV